MHGFRAGNAGPDRYSGFRARRRLAVVTLGIAAAVVGGVLPAAPARAAATIVVNGGSGGRIFDGVGAISGGGGNSRLLIDYPETQRSQILDYLFKPGYGAAMQIMKLEIGGDTNSTSGAEPSHEHVRGAVNCNRGYEWWLVGQARRAIPDIKLVGLAWGAPGWIGNGNFWSKDSIDYLVGWLGLRGHARPDDRLPRRLEREGQRRQLVREPPLDPELPRLRQRQDRGLGRLRLGRRRHRAEQLGLRQRGLGVRQRTTSAATAARRPTARARATPSTRGKQLWASENGSDDYNDGAPAMARGINRGYIDGKMTAYLNWPRARRDHPERALAHHGRGGRRPALVGGLLDRQERLGDGAHHPVHRPRLALPGQPPPATSAATATTAATSR